MKKILNSVVAWIKANKVASAIIAFLLYSLYSGGTLSVPSFNSYKYSDMSGSEPGIQSRAIGGMVPTALNFGGKSDYYEESATPITNAYTEDRKVITNSSMGILVKDVTSTVDSIHNQATAIGGYMVSKYISTPEEGGYGEIVVRVPLEKRDALVEFLRKVGIKVVNENITASDVTDQYTDFEKRLGTLETINNRYLELMQQTTDVEQILKIQRYLIQTQSEIDSIKGQMNSLNTKSATTLVRVNLTTDELALSYSPNSPWRPNVIFKMAVRSLVLTLRALGEKVIWFAVYSVIWVPVLVAYIAFRKYWKKRKQTI